jgi:hypothetical protein
MKTANCLKKSATSCGYSISEKNGTIFHPKTAFKASVKK